MPHEYFCRAESHKLFLHTFAHSHTKVVANKNTLENPWITIKMAFEQKWLLEFPWLRYDETTARAFCTTCQLGNAGKTVFNSTGYAGGERRKLKRNQIADHAPSKAHGLSVDACAKQSVMRMALARAAALEEQRAARDV